jgi:hypothetical protein
MVFIDNFPPAPIVHRFLGVAIWKVICSFYHALDVSTVIENGAALRIAANGFSICDNRDAAAACA